MMNTLFHDGILSAVHMLLPDHREIVKIHCGRSNLPLAPCDLRHTRFARPEDTGGVDCADLIRRHHPEYDNTRQRPVTDIFARTDAVATANVKPGKPRTTRKTVPAPSVLRVRDAPVAQTIRKAYGLSQRLLARLLGVPATTLARWERTDELPPATRAKLKTMAGLLRSLSRVIPKADLPAWLITPNDACRSVGGRAPADLMAKGQFDKIEATIYFLEKGVAY
jgi:DNA-binding transcriptional regulator YiaG